MWEMKKLSNLALGLALVLAAPALAQPTRPGTQEPLVLWYRQSAVDWQTEALPIGNGRLGAMVFGDALHEHLQLNEDSLWTGNEKDTGQYQNLADLFVDLDHGGQGAAESYRRQLDLATAIHTIEYASGGVSYRREYFASHPAGVLALRFTAGKPGAYSGSIRLADAHGARTTAAGNLLTAAGQLDNGLAYETQVMVVPTGGRITLADDALRFEKATAITILVGAGTNYVPDRSKQWRGDRPHERIGAQLRAAAAQGIDQLRAGHVRDYQSLFQRVRLDLGATPETVRALPTDDRLVEYNKGAADPQLEALFFQFGRYLLISSSRPGSLPANLQGLWNNSNNPPWRCDYHSNINVQMNYWPAEVTNLSECHLPFLAYVDSLRGVRTEATRRYYASEVDPKKVERKTVRGWTVQTENNIFGAGSFKWNPPGSAWYARHFWEHYAFTQDRDYLRTMAYPVLKEVCEFWEDHLVALPDGSLATPDGWSPEHGPEEKGVTYDQEIVWDLFTNYIQASTVLDIDTEYRDTVKRMRDRLAQPRIGKWGQLQEWMEDIDDPKDDHRHVSHLFALYPGRQITMDGTPELAKAAKVSLAARGDKSTGWAMAWRINFWARLRDGDHAYALLRNLLHIVGKGSRTDYGQGGGVYPNLLDTHPPFQIDGNFGATAGIAEMLIQSHAGQIHLLPALPAAWATGSVKGLRARGNVTIDMAWRDGKLVSATLRSPAASRQTVRCGGRTAAVDIAGGRPLILDAGLKAR
jgi:alpha-L-fucosidase 2